MTMEQELAYWKQQTDTLRQLKREAEEKQNKANALVDLTPQPPSLRGKGEHGRFSIND